MDDGAKLPLQPDAGGAGLEGDVDPYAEEKKVGRVLAKRAVEKIILKVGRKLALPPEMWTAEHFVAVDESLKEGLDWMKQNGSKEIPFFVAEELDRRRKESPVLAAVAQRALELMDLVYALRRFTAIKTGSLKDEKWIGFWDREVSWGIREWSVEEKIEWVKKRLKERKVVK